MNEAVNDEPKLIIKHFDLSILIWLISAHFIPFAPTIQ